MSFAIQPSIPNPEMLKKVGAIVIIFSLAHVIANPTLWLCLGVCFATLAPLSLKSDFKNESRQTLHFSILLMGFGIPLSEVISVGYRSFPLTLVSVVISLSIGILLYRKLRIDRETGFLITVGTTICGGSAIAALSGAMDAKSETIAKSTFIVFILNAVALFVFPVIGHLLHLSQLQFGTWSALAIHDTSSVVGAATTFGDISLHTAVLIKLTRSLWILPLTLAVSLLNHRSSQKVRIPWFILGFVISAATAAILPQFQSFWHFLSANAKPLFAVAMFLIGTQMSLGRLKESLSREFLMAILLWAFVSIASLIAIQQFFV